MYEIVGSNNNKLLKRDFVISNDLLHQKSTMIFDVSIFFILFILFKHKKKKKIASKRKKNRDNINT